jgi:hypothetical protein
MTKVRQEDDPCVLADRAEHLEILANELKTTVEQLTEKGIRDEQRRRHGMKAVLLGPERDDPPARARSARRFTT